MRWRLTGVLMLTPVLDEGLTLKQFLDALKTDLACLEGVQSEAEQGGGKHQAFHIQDQGHEPSDAECACLQLATAQGEKQQQRDGGDALQQWEQRASGAGQSDGAVPVMPVE